MFDHNPFLWGMAAQAFIAGILGATKIIKLSPMQQLLAGALLVLTAIVRQ